MNFKDKWIEIFRGGRQTDSAGNAHDGDNLIDAAVSSFDPAYHEPPVVLGHPKTDDPAYGWVESLRKTVKNGAAVLEAKLRDIAPDLSQWVETGRYKKRSASFYPDGRLRHVGFLGAVPPAVKGLAPLPAGFSDDADSAVFEFSDRWAWRTVADTMRRIREWLIEDKGAEAADRIIPAYDIEALLDESNRPVEVLNTGPAVYNEPTIQIPKSKIPVCGQRTGRQNLTGEEKIMPDKTFTEADLEAAKKEAAEKTRAETEQRIRAEYAEKDALAQREAARGEISAWCDQMVASGKIAPAWVDMGIREFAQGLIGTEAIEFGEVKKTPVQWFREFIEELPKLIEFNEIATRDKNVAGGDAAGQLDAIVRQKMSADSGLSYSDAFSEASREHLGLAIEYKREIYG